MIALLSFKPATVNCDGWHSNNLDKWWRASNVSCTIQYKVTILQQLLTFTVYNIIIIEYINIWNIYNSLTIVYKLIRLTDISDDLLNSFSSLQN